MNQISSPLSSPQLDKSYKLLESKLVRATKFGIEWLVQSLIKDTEFKYLYGSIAWHLNFYVAKSLEIQNMDSENWSVTELLTMNPFNIEILISELDKNKHWDLINLLQITSGMIQKYLFHELTKESGSIEHVDLVTFINFIESLSENSDYESFIRRDDIKRQFNYYNKFEYSEKQKSAMIKYLLKVNDKHCKKINLVLFNLMDKLYKKNTSLFNKFVLWINTIEKPE